MADSWRPDAVSGDSHVRLPACQLGCGVMGATGDTSAGRSDLEGDGSVVRGAGRNEIGDDADRGAGLHWWAFRC